MTDISRRMVRTTVFMYDCSRLLFLVSLLGTWLALNPPAGPFGGTGTLFPYMMYTAPNALFPLMSFFLLIRFEVSRAYIPLYISGKVLSLLCLALWLCFAVLMQKTPGLQRLLELPRTTLWAFFVGLADLGCIMGMCRLNEKQPDEKQPSLVSEQEAGLHTPQEEFSSPAEGGE